MTLLLICVVAFASALPKSTQSVSDKILGEFLNKPTKELFKVWHHVMNKSYDYNTAAGIQKYRNFKAQVAIIKAHNAKNACYKKGLNEYSDMTFQEFKAHFNLNHSVTIPELKKKMRGLLSLDDEDDDYDDNNHPYVYVREDPNVLARTSFDHRKHMQGVRNQGGCGSCWSFSTMATIEGNWNMKGSRLSEHLSTQQLVDCDTNNSGCNGGWYTDAIKFFYTRLPAYESSYPYTAKEGTCAVGCEIKSAPVQVKGQVAKYDGDSIYVLASQGPVAIAVYVDDNFYAYKSGIFTSKCEVDSVNHAVVLVGYGIQQDDNNDDDNNNDCLEAKVGTEYWIIQNVKVVVQLVA
jgi:C1A family cysteine protease